MSRKKKKIDNRMTEFEYDSVWMAIRYACGRHTIASHSYASQVARNCYGRFQTDEREEFTAYDINREIESHMRMCFNFFVDEYKVTREFYQPLDRLFEFIEKQNIETIDELKKIKSVHVEYIGGEFVYDIRYFDDEKDKDSYKPYYSTSDIHDLIVWQQLANCLDRNTHKYALLKDGSVCEFFYSWVEAQGELNYKKVKTPVDAFCANASVNTYISEDAIVEVRDENSF